jgi:UDP-N-acetylmuramate--alanine ligase
MREKYPTKKLTVIFQPHQVRRVLEFRDAFKNTIAQFDDRIIYSLYPARENLDALLAEFPIP